MSIGSSMLSVVPHDEQKLPCLGHFKKLLDCKTVRVVPPQHIIFSQGESPHTVCLICNGLVKLTRTESEGKPVIVGLRRTGWLLGAGALLPGRSYASTAETVTRSKLCLVPTEKLKQAMATNALFSKWVAMMYGREVYSSMINISERCSLTGRQRLEKFLWEIVQNLNTGNTDKPVKLPIPLKHWELAQLLALTPQHLSRLIRQMEKEGIIRRKNGWLVLSEPRKLWHPG
jgi:CRP/FNR family cyclic AMP-dependent transcriptional regulator